MGNIETLVRPNILKLSPYSSARDEFNGVDGVFLDANENPFGALNRYPDPYQKSLKSRLSKLKKIDSENIFIGNGSDEVIDLTFRIFCQPGQDKALTFSPTYGMYEVSAGINEVDLIKLPLTEAFQIDRQLLAQYWNRRDVKLLFICSPNNPTGNVFRKEDIEFILQQFKGIVIIDEAYIDFSNTESCLRWIDEFPRLVVTQTFSKAWGLAAARVGVAYANTEVIRLFNKIKPPYNVSTLNQIAAIEALSNIELFEKRLKTILVEKDNLIRELSRLKRVRKIYPSDANFLLVQVNNATQIYKTLVDRKVIVRNRHALVDNCIRITIGTAEENRQLITLLKKIDK